MSDDLSKSIDSLRESADRLNNASNILNQAVQKIETILESELKIGISAYVELENPRTLDKRFLAYLKVGSRFRIAIVQKHLPAGPFTKETQEEVKPWSDCSRVEKTETAISLPELIKVISESVQRNITDVEDATATASDVLKALGGPDAGIIASAMSEGTPLRRGRTKKLGATALARNIRIKPEATALTRENPKKKGA